MKDKTKSRILYLYQIIQKHTDRDHPMSTEQLIDRLRLDFGIEVNRNTLGNDMEVMMQCGYPVGVIHSTQNRYYYTERILSVPELRLLIDVIASSKFVTQKKSEELIGRLLALTNEYEAKKLSRHISLEGRVKSDNEKGYPIVATINEAMDQGRRISFRYTDFNSRREKIIRHNGKPYIVSPYALISDGDYYYVAGYCSSHRKIQHFRLDRIDGVPEILPKAAVPAPQGFDAGAYTKRIFSMFGSADEAEEVTLVGEAAAMKGMVDKFGMDFELEPLENDRFRARVVVCPGPTFYRWVFGWNGALRIEGPDRIRKAYRKMAHKVLKE